MSHLLTTVGIAFVFVFLALLGLAAGWLVSGKVLERGSCGRKPGSKPAKGCGTDPSCSICGSGTPEEKDDKNC